MAAFCGCFVLLLGIAGMIILSLALDFKWAFRNIRCEQNIVAFTTKEMDESN